MRRCARVRLLGSLFCILFVACSGGREENIACTTDAECPGGFCADGECMERNSASPAVTATSRADGVDAQIEHQVVGDEVCTQGAQSVCTLTSGSKVIWRAPDVPGYRFTGWTGDAGCKGTDNVLELQVQQDVECVAHYVARRKVSGGVDDGQGAIAVTSTSPFAECTGDSCTVDAGSSVQLAAPARDGFRLSGWEGDGCPNSTDSQISVTPSNGDIRCNAQYVAALTVRGNVQGPTASVAASSADANAHCDGSLCAVDPAGTVTLVAPMVEGYRFGGWSGDAVCSGVELTLVVSNVQNNVSCTGNYVARHRVTATSSGAAPAPMLSAKSDDAFASCEGTSCVVDEGGQVTLLAPSVAGMRLKTWVGDGCAAANGASASASNVVRDVICEAQYVEGVSVIGTVLNADAMVTATSTSEGAVCTPGQCVIDVGGDVQLSAPALPGRTFLGWEGDDDCTGRELTLSLRNVRESASCSARFAARFTAEGTTANGAPGTVAASSDGTNARCTAGVCAVDQGSTVTLAAKAADNARFTGWTGGGACTGADATLVLRNVEQNVSCRANFVGRFRVTGVPTPADAGSVVVTSLAAAADCAGANCTVDAGSDVALLASANAGYRFSAWSDCANSTFNPLLVTNVQANASCRASFERITFQVDGQSSAGGAVMGEVEGDACANARCTVPYGSAVSFMAVPIDGYTFTGWSGCSDDRAPMITLANVTGPATCRANFAIMQFTVTAVAGTGGGITLDGGACSGAQCSVNYGDSVTLTAKEQTGYRFTGWSDCSNSTNAELTLSSIDASKRCVASFELLEYTVVARAATDGGDVNCKGAGCTVRHGEDIELIALPDANHNFSGWSCSPASAAATAASFTLPEITQDFTCAASFTPKPRSVRTSVAASGGGITNCADGCTVADGESVTLTATPDDTHNFQSWSCTPARSGTTQSFSTGALHSDLSCQATFSRKSYQVTVVSGGGHTPLASTGGVACDNASCSVAPGGSATVQVQLATQGNSTMLLKGWSGCNVTGTTLINDGQTIYYTGTVNDVQADQTCTADFTDNGILVGVTNPGSAGPLAITFNTGSGYCTTLDSTVVFCIVASGTSAHIVAPYLDSTGTYRFSEWGCQNTTSSSPATPITDTGVIPTLAGANSAVCTAFYAQI